MTVVDAPSVQSALAPSERLRAYLASGPATLTIDAAFARALLAENVAIRNMVADDFAAQAVAEAKPILDRAGAMLQAADRKLRAALALNSFALAAAFCIGVAVGWF